MNHFINNPSLNDDFLGPRTGTIAAYIWASVC
jgi:hypothetical protein